MHPSEKSKSFWNYVLRLPQQHQRRHLQHDDINNTTTLTTTLTIITTRRHQRHQQQHHRPTRKKLQKFQKRIYTNWAQKNIPEKENSKRLEEDEINYSESQKIIFLKKFFRKNSLKMAASGQPTITIEHIHHRDQFYKTFFSYLT